MAAYEHRTHGQESKHFSFQNFLTVLFAYQNLMGLRRMQKQALLLHFP